MELFISWSGKRSHDAALLLREWLQDVIQYADPFVSSVDIAQGQRWQPELVAALNRSSFGIVCLTPANVRAPWVLFEAGAIANKFPSEGRVSSLLLGLSPGDVSPPLSQFQNTRIEKGAMFKLVRDINAVSDEKERLPAEQLTRVLEYNWPRLADDLKAISDGAASDARLSTEAAPRRDQASMIEEMLETVRSVDRRLTALPSDLRRTLIPERSGARAAAAIYGLGSRPSEVEWEPVPAAVIPSITITGPVGGNRSTPATETSGGANLASASSATESRETKKK